MSPIKMLRRRPFAPVAYPTSPFFQSLFRSAEDFEDRFARMFESPWTDQPVPSAESWFPAIDVTESSGEFLVKAELPGLEIKDINITFADGRLTLQGEKRDEREQKGDGTRFHMWERTFGSFSRTLPFPSGIASDKIDAEFKDGVLRVRLPKTPEAKQTQRSIPIAG
jgi:HSP20 family protein